MDDAEIEEMMRQTAVSLRRSLERFWPAKKRNEIGEANPILHVGHVLAKHEFAIYAQVPEVGGGRVDLVGLHPTSSFGLLIEGKRLFNTGKASSMAGDLRRMDSLRLVDEYRYLEGQADGATILLATTWGKEIASWWSASARATRPNRCREDYGWTALGTGLSGCAKVGAIRLWGDDSEYSQCLLYAIKRRGRGLTC